ncbi:Protein fam43b [Saguinus oedipus]|uniref:Protein fam43b n=1 Tax=Saguinus oedipus TaxID=9490 RepID=A0ABQ9THB2_SAGOE|nr:Protein fam43b [Saguinus oedipus]
MLPWRRNKFVLVEDEAKCKAKSLSPGLAYTSLLSSFLRSCPDRLPDWPLERLGRVFCSWRQKVELNKEDPTYTVWYLGNAVTLHAKGDGCTDDAVGKIWARCGPGGGTKMKLTLGPHGIRMQPSYLLRRITYCTADGRRPRVFAWVYRHQARHKAVVLRCQAVLLARAHKARALAGLLLQTALAAFSDFKRLQRQSDERHLCQQHLRAGSAAALMPRAQLRRLLNAKCAYRPPPGERSRGEPRLSSTQEEEEDDNAEEREGGAPQRERPEVLSLAQELRTCSLRGAPPPQPLASPAAGRPAPGSGRARRAESGGTGLAASGPARQTHSLRPRPCPLRLPRSPARVSPVVSVLSAPPPHFGSG